MKHSVSYQLETSDSEKGVLRIGHTLIKRWYASVELALDNAADLARELRTTVIIKQHFFQGVPEYMLLLEHEWSFSLNPKISKSIYRIVDNLPQYDKLI